MSLIATQSHQQTQGSRLGSAAVPGRFVSVGWVSSPELQFPEWAVVGRRLGAIARCSQWWVGDWVRYGARRYGEQYVRASKLTGYDVQSLRNMAYVASRFSDISRRRDDLSWSHHAELAALPPAEQDRWLARAAQERFSVSDLRAELRLERRRRSADGPALDARSRAHSKDGEPSQVCPNCGHTLAEWDPPVS